MTAPTHTARVPDATSVIARTVCGLDRHRHDTKAPAPKPCECPEPDGYCDACEDTHGHTCIICGYDFCGLCWETDAHNDDCKRTVTEDGSIRDDRGLWTVHASEATS